MHKGVLIAAPASGSGKTLVTCALLAAMQRRGLAVRAFKSGPDYIDPMFHSRVLTVPSRNLDPFFSDDAQLRALYRLEQERFSYSVIEGAMGLYDGLGGTQETGSAYRLAEALDVPIVLVLDAHGMGRTMLAVLAGLLQYDKSRRICGVLLNRTSEPFCRTIAPLIEEELRLPVFGCFPMQKELQLKSRYLGLMLPEELDGLRAQIDRAADALEEHADMDRLLQLLSAYRQTSTPEREPDVSLEPPHLPDAERPRIAVARDRAFCFYYEDNLRLLAKTGAELVSFSPLTDMALPPETDGILLGGGYPELFARQLSENTPMLQSVRAALDAGLPSVAECGGFLYLHETLTDENEKSWPLVGAVKGGCRNTGHLTRFGYVTVTEHAGRFLSGSIRAHEFHYYDSDDNGSDCTAVKPTGFAEWACIHADAQHWWGFPHLYYPSNPQFAAHFAEICAAHKRRRKDGT